MADIELMNYLCEMKKQAPSKVIGGSIVADASSNQTASVDTLDQLKEENRRLKRTLMDRFETKPKK
jgi:hypothetical protein